MKLIDKSKLLEGLKELKQNLSASPIVVIKDVESLVESLEVKEVDLGKAYGDFLESRKKKGYMLFDVAKHFFELGMAVSNPTTASDKDLDDDIVPTLLTRD